MHMHTQASAGKGKAAVPKKRRNKWPSNLGVLGKSAGGDRVFTSEIAAELPTMELEPNITTPGETSNYSKLNLGINLSIKTRSFCPMTLFPAPMCKKRGTRGEPSLCPRLYPTYVVGP